MNNDKQVSRMVIEVESSFDNGKIEMKVNKSILEVSGLDLISICNESTKLLVAVYKKMGFPDSGIKKNLNNCINKHLEINKGDEQ